MGKFISPGISVLLREAYEMLQRPCSAHGKALALEDVDTEHRSFRRVCLLFHPTVRPDTGRRRNERPDYGQRERLTAEML